MTIEGMIIGGASVGIAIGIIFPQAKVGCIALLVVPVTMIGCIVFWQSLHPESIRSTSALDFVFAPLWPSIGAMAGYVLSGGLQALDARRKRKGS